jgi:hypothetical protein
MYPTAVGDEKAAANGNTRTVQAMVINTSHQLRVLGMSLWASELIRFTSPNDQAQRPPPETPVRLQQSLANYPHRPTEKRGGG